MQTEVIEKFDRVSRHEPLKIGDWVIVAEPVMTRTNGMAGQIVGVVGDSFIVSFPHYTFADNNVHNSDWLVRLALDDAEEMAKDIAQTQGEAV
jgi:hypothetical protein